MGKNNAEHIKTLNISVEMAHYCMYDFIKAIREKPNLWQRKHEDFHNRDQRERSWRAVARELYPGYDTLQIPEQQELAKIILKRWKNTRDSFLRAYRLQHIDGEHARPYIYEKELMFLLKGRNGSVDSYSAEHTKVTSPGKKCTGTENVFKGIKRNMKSKRATCTKISKRKKNSPELDAESATKKPTICTPALVSRSQRSMRQHTKRRSSQSIKLIQNDKTNEEIAGGNYSKIQSTATIDLINKSPAKVLSTHPIKDPPEANNDIKLSNLFNINKEEDDLAIACFDSINDSHGIGISRRDDFIINTSEPISHDPDQAFFDTIKPHLMRMTDEEKLDFKIEVLRILKNFQH